MTITRRGRTRGGSALSADDPPSRALSLLAGEFGRFIVVGAIKTAISYAVFLALFSGLSLHFMLAGVLGFIAGAVPGFALTRGWTFRSSASVATSGPRYVVVQLIALTTHSASQWVGEAALGVPEIHTQLLGIAASTLVNFGLTRQFVFSSRAGRA